MSKKYVIIKLRDGYNNGIKKGNFLYWRDNFSGYTYDFNILEAGIYTKQEIVKKSHHQIKFYENATIGLLLNVNNNIDKDIAVPYNQMISIEKEFKRINGEK